MQNLDFNTKIKLLGLILVVGIIITLITLLFLNLRKKTDKSIKIKKFFIKFLIFCFSYCLLTLGAFLYIYLSTSPNIVYTKPSMGTAWDNYQKPLEIKFNVPIVISNIQSKISPDTSGKWVWDNYLGINNLTRSGKFYPDQSFFPNKRIVVYITGIGRMGLSSEYNEAALNLESTSLPEIISTIPINKSENIKRDTQFQINLNKDNNNLAEWTFTFEPKIDFTIVSPYTNSIIIKPAKQLDQTTKYKLKINRRSILYSYKDNKIIDYGDDLEQSTELNFVTAQEPFIQNFSPQGNTIRSNEIIKVQFSLAMDRSSVESNTIITPQTSGKFSWQDDSNMVFTPDNMLTKGIGYTVKFNSGTASKLNGIFGSDGVFQFQTIGAISINNIYPNNNSNRVRENIKISVDFNQNVDKQSAQNNFRIDPFVNGSYSWQGNKVYFSPSNNYLFNTKYKISIIKGVKSLEGLDSIDDVNSYFTTIPAEIILANVPEITQPYGSFSCNIYSADMLLAWKGFSLTATSIISEIGNNPNQNNGQWSGDPNVEYVGNSDGSWGYGVYWNPIQKLFTKRGIRTEIKYAWNVSSIANSIANGQPVIIWRYNGVSQDTDKNWIASDNGVAVHGINGQHGGVVVGFRGSISNPTQFLLNDPWYGIGWYNVSTFDYDWSRLNRMALVVY